MVEFNEAIKKEIERPAPRGVIVKTTHAMVELNRCIDCQKPIEWWAERCEHHEMNPMNVKNTARHYLQFVHEAFSAARDERPDIADELVGTENKLRLHHLDQDQLLEIEFLLNLIHGKEKPMNPDSMADQRVKHGLLLLGIDEAREKFGTIAINFSRTPSATNFTKLMSSARELQDAYTCLNEFREVQRSKEREKENR